MPELIPVLDQREIQRQIAKLADRLSRDYRGRELVMIGVLKGAFLFLADLVRQVRLEKIIIDFFQASSYGADTLSSGNIVLKRDIDVDIRGKDVLVVEDIIDTGLTMAWLVDRLQGFKPASVRICAMIDKRERRKTDITIDYVGSVVDKGFLVGYGLDYAEHYRNLPGIYQLKL